jgi:Ser/Thr protein kinase RdoA (MazF antagonist)
LNHQEEPEQGFPLLTPDTILTLAEQELGCQCQAICRQLNSYINRVFELETVDGHGLIIKFYRPGRWSREAIEEADLFTLELQKEEIPVVAPLLLQNKTTLAQYQDMLFSIFPKMGGRFLDEFSEDQWLAIGRLLGRMHQIGASKPATHRQSLHPLKTTAAQVRFLADNNFMPSHLQPSFKQICTKLIELITPLFADQETIRLHGDCHFANLIHRPDQGFFLIDFDDMINGPPIQDVWMLFPSYHQESLPEIELFLEGYQTFRPFNRSSLQLIEPLRAMRYIHYAAWCAHQSIDPGFIRKTPDWGNELYWQEEINDLVKQITRIEQTPAQTNNPMYR